MTLVHAEAAKNIRIAAERTYNMVQLDQIKYELGRTAEKINELGGSL